MLLSNIGRTLMDFLCLDHEDTEITYQDCLEFLTFMDYYVSKLIGSRELKKFCAQYPGKTLLDKMTASDIAFAILCYENGVDVWLECFKMKRMKFGQGSISKDCIPEVPLSTWNKIEGV